MIDLWIARDGPRSDGRPGDIAIYQDRPQWCEDIDGFQGRGVRCLEETKTKRFPIANGEMARLVIDTASIVTVTSAPTVAESTLPICEPLGITR